MDIRLRRKAIVAILGALSPYLAIGLEYYDFGHDGHPALIVIASTCATGTAGPDIHAVYVREVGSGFRELAVPDVRASGRADQPVDQEQTRQLSGVKFHFRILEEECCLPR